jgi:hypothetical protein
LLASLILLAHVFQAGRASGIEEKFKDYKKHEFNNNIELQLCSGFFSQKIFVMEPLSLILGKISFVCGCFLVTLSKMEPS